MVSCILHTVLINELYVHVSIHGCYSFCLVSYTCRTRLWYSLQTEICQFKKALPSLQHGFLRCKKSVVPNTNVRNVICNNIFTPWWKRGSAIHDHYNTTGHDISIDNFSFVGTKDQNMARPIKEAILIRVNDPSLYRNIGKYQLPYIWDQVLMTYQNSSLSKQPHNIWLSVTKRLPHTRWFSKSWATTNNISLTTSWLPVK